MTDRSYALSVVILTFNRKDELAAQLDRLARQTRIADTEIIVVDNHSTDGTEEMIRARPEPIVYIRRADNIGAVARSDGMEAARAPLVVTLDDDVYLLRDDELSRIERVFAAHPEAAGMNFKVVDPEKNELMPFHWYHPRPHERWGNETFETDYISEGAVAFRRSALQRVGCYPRDFFISHEGIDLALRLINAGLRVFYTGEVSIVHRYSLQQRASWRNAYYNTRNFLWVIVKYAPFPAILGQLAYRSMTTFVFCLRSGHVLWWFKAVADGIWGLPAQLRARQPLSGEAQRRLAEIRKLKPSFGYKVANFFLRTRLMNERQRRS